MSGISSQVGFEPTPEQVAITADSFAPGRLLSIEAFAGTGKTTTLEAIARAHEGKKFLYLAYNRSIADEARRRFPVNTNCMTIHGMAFRRFGHRFKHQLGNLRVNDLLDAGLVNRDSLSDAYEALAGLNRFMVSNDPEINEEHLGKKAELIGMTRKIWNAIFEGKVPMPHDAYVKQWVLDGAALDRGYDVVLLDEAQDSNPITSEGIVMPLCRTGKSAVAIVGDQYQSIYGWRGAVNAMQKLRPEADVLYRLTTSFRFGDEVADLASLLLNQLRGAEVALRGVAQPKSDDHAAILSRSNAGIIRYAYEDLQGERLHFAGTDARQGWNPRMRYGFAAFEDLAKIRKGKLRNVVTPHLKIYRSWSEVKEVVATGADPELASGAGLVEDFGEALSPALRSLENRATGPGEAAMSLSTAHTAKGLEWGRVMMLPGFLDIRSDEKLAKAQRDGTFNEETNLIYVAVTRAKKQLELCPEVGGWLRGQPGGVQIANRLQRPQFLVNGVRVA